MEESGEFAINNNINIMTDKINMSENIDISNSDPIPALLVPIKKLQKPQSLITHILSNLPNKKINLNQIRSKISSFLIYKNLQFHNSSPEQKNLMLINDLIESKETHFIAIFKDYLISDYQEEFLRRFFNINEIIEVLPKFYQYYKNYLNFFCKGTFCDFDLNEIMQEYGECQAEIYYNRNYGHKDRKSKKDKKGNLDAIRNEKENNTENMSNINTAKSIFTKSIEYSIEKVKNSKNDIINKNEKREEISNIKPYNNSRETTMILPDNSAVSSKDIITKENSIRYIIRLMKKKKERINLNKKIKNKKKEIVSKNNKNTDFNYKNIINNSNTNKKRTQNLSKTTSNLNIKNPKKTKNIKSRNKRKNLKPNYMTSDIHKNRNIPSISSYKKYIDILTYKQKNKSNKSSDPRIKICQEEFNLSSKKNNKKNKTKNIISSINVNDIFGHFNLFSNNYFNNNIQGHKNKVNSSLFLLNGNLVNGDKNNKNTYNYNTMFPLSISKNNINKNKFNTNAKKSEKKEKRKSKNNEKETNNNSNKYLYFNPKIKSLIKSIKNVSSSLRNINHNINNSNKTLTYSTVNNCNININNNIILSNNYFNNKHHQMNNISNKKILEKNIQKKFNAYNDVIKSHTSRNNQTDLNRFKTEINFLNSIANQEANKNIINPNKNITNIQFKLFRKSNNDFLFKHKYSDKSKKYNNSNTHKRNFSLKNIPITLRNKLYKNENNSSNKIGKLFEKLEFSSTSKIYKNLALKKINNNIHQKKIIFDYKKK